MEEDRIRRIPPHSDEAERSVIGSMLMSAEAASAASEILTREDFYDRLNGTVFEAMKELLDGGRPIDLVTLKEALARRDLPEEYQNMSFVRDLLTAVPTSANVREYSNIVREKAVLRRLIEAASAIENDCYRGQEETGDILDRAEKEIFAVTQQRSADNFVPIREVVYNTLEAISAASKAKGTVTGLSTGFTDLDYKTSGFQNSDFILIAARPSMGKTALVLNIAEYMAFRDERPCAMFSLEMSSEQLMNRLISLESRVDSQKIRTGKLNDEEWSRVVEASGVIANSGLIIDDTPGITMQEFRSKARKYKLEADIQIIFIDYLQLMAGSGRAKDSRQQEISDISRALKSLARELNIPIVALSQLNRSVETRDDHRPMLSDLRESGAIEQDADVVMFIYRDDYYHKDTEEKNVAEVIIAKQRNGPIGTVKLVWLPEYTMFRNIRKQDERRQNVHN
ncbi:MAG: replicative DNA helicase [Lachnospiraceae bacterium]|nr:replicative DNA helicase [Lachnospiraceae bacterium]